MAKRAGAYRSEKRKKEVKRQKKQEEKRLRRSGLLKPSGESENPEGIDPEAALSGDTGEELEEGQEEGQIEEAEEAGEEKAEEKSA
ncbi:MAG: hypothetical protein HZA15_10080 [Nitrospirae bacterium]|nr:hypothetical protein [Nitrospirota bacterium]